LAFGAGALGLAAIGVGSYFGIRAIDRQNTADDLCPNLDHCDPHGFAVSEQAASDARVATYFIAGGVVFLGAGAVLFLTARSDQRGKSAGLTFTGGF
jgi:serine/threonine-protein kinase